MYAIVDIKGFQYRLKKGDKLRVPRHDLEVGAKLTIPEVLLVAGDADIKVGAPFVDGAEVDAVVTEQGRYDKITVFKKKRRKDYRVKRGHRQDFTEIEVTDIVTSGGKKGGAKEAEAKPEPAPEQTEETTVAPEEAVEEKAENAPGAAEETVEIVDESAADADESPDTESQDDEKSE